MKFENDLGTKNLFNLKITSITSYVCMQFLVKKTLQEILILLTECFEGFRPSIMY
jgi:hypothetical protein